LKSIGGTGTSKKVLQDFASIWLFSDLFYLLDGISVIQQRKDDAPRGLGDFKRRLNRDTGYDKRNWDDTPRTERERSVRLPNVGWEWTPRNDRGYEGGWGRVSNKTWDATPRAARGTSPDGDGGAFGIDSREWEEEQVRLDRDWYTTAEEGGVAGDEEHNPLSRYEDLTIVKQAELATKQTVSIFLQSRILRLKFDFYRKKSLPDKHNM
jgi:pre-mRNA-splicing factor ATP-dependent RNA helicase DHX38/PRP16